MDSVSVVLNTRHGTLNTTNDFSTCKWILPDPIYAPGPDHVLYADLEFISLTGDHKRINHMRCTTNFHFQVKTDDEIVDHFIQIPDGSYTKAGIVTVVDTKIQTLALPFRLIVANAGVELPHHTTEEIAITRQPVGNDPPFPPNTEVRLVHSAEHRGAEVLGFHETTIWVDDTIKNLVSKSPMDLHGTTTVAIGASSLNGESPDHVKSHRRRSIFKVIPIADDRLHTASTYTRTGPKYGHKISTRHLSVIEMGLWDDMGLPFDPRHHWSVGLIIWARKKPKNFMHYM